MIWDIIHREMVSQIVSQVQIAAEKTRIMTQTRPQWQFFERTSTNTNADCRFS